MPGNSKELLSEFVDKILPYSSLGALGGIALQLNEVRKGNKFRLRMLISNIILSGWIGRISGSFIPDSIGDIKFSLISISGFLSYPILDLIEKKGLTLLIKKITGKE